MAPSWWPEVKKIMDDYGVPLEVWVPIMWGESRGNPNATNDTRGKTDLPAGTVPEYSVGLFQINLLARYPNATPEQLAAYAEQAKDPVTNASLQGQRIAAAWNAVKGTLAGQPAETWAPVVAVRSGHPGGSVANPCVSDWCKRYQASLTQRAANLIPLLQQGVDFFGADWSGRLQGAAAGALASAGLGGTPVGNLAGNTAGSLGGAVGRMASESLSDSVSTLVGKIDWLRVSVFIVGLILVAASLWGLVSEPLSGGAKGLVRVAAKAVDQPVDTALDVAGVK